VSEELDELIEMARTIRMTPEQGNPTSRKARDPSTPLRAGDGAPAAQLCLRQHAGSPDSARDDMTRDRIDRAAERLEKEK
jgi:hypothetical protein